MPRLLRLQACSKRGCRLWFFVDSIALHSFGPQLRGSAILREIDAHSLERSFCVVFPVDSSVDPLNFHNLLYSAVTDRHLFPELDSIHLLSEPGLLWDIDANCSPLGPGSLQHLAIAKFVISPCQWTPPSPEGKARPSLAKVALIEVNPPTRVPSMDLSLPSPGIFWGSYPPTPAPPISPNATLHHYTLAWPRITRVPSK